MKQSEKTEKPQGAGNGPARNTDTSRKDAARQQTQQVSFSGYEWTLKSGERLGPGPNRWDPANVTLDSTGRLRFTIRRDESSPGGGWSCAEVGMTGKRLHFGLYEFQTTGPIGRLDPNVVLGLFNYPPRDVGPGATNEIDIEYARWGNARWPNGNFTLWTAKPGEKSVSHTFTVPPDIEQATHRFLWLPDRILWTAQRGHARDMRDERGEFARWEFKPPADSGLIPQKPLPVLVNLWLFQGKPPIDGKPVQITLDRFAYHPRP